MRKTFWASVKIDGLQTVRVRVEADSLWDAREKLEAEYLEGTVRLLEEKDGIKLFEADIRQPGADPRRVDIAARNVVDARQRLALMYGHGSAFNISEPDAKIHERIARDVLGPLMRKETIDQRCPICGGRISVFMDSLPYWFDVSCPCGKCRAYYKDI